MYHIVKKVEIDLLSRFSNLWFEYIFSKRSKIIPKIIPAAKITNRITMPEIPTLSKFSVCGCISFLKYFDFKRLRMPISFSSLRLKHKLIFKKES